MYDEADLDFLRRFLPRLIDGYGKVVIYIFVKRNYIDQLTKNNWTLCVQVIIMLRLLLQFFICLFR